MLEDRTTGYFSEFETQTQEERRSRMEEAALAVAAAAWKGSGEFRRRMDKAGLAPEDVRSFKDWLKIPCFTKKDLIAYQQEQGVGGMLSCAVGELSRVYMSPGPIFDPEGRGRDYWGWGEAFFAAGFRKGDLVQMTFGYHLTPAGLMLEEPLRDIGCAVIPAGPGNTQVQVELLTKLPVTGFVGMASYLKIVKDKAKAEGLDVRKALRLAVAFVAAERLAPSLRAELEGELAIKVRQGYGTADVGCAAYECRELGGMHLSSRCLVEICDPATGQPVAPGETGQVVLTPLTTAYPLVRLATGDLSYLVEGACACGRTASKLGAIVGRVDDTAKVKGQFIYPHQAAEVMAAYPMVARWQLLVDNPGGRDSLVLRLVLRGELPKDRFVATFQDKLKLKPTLEIVAEDELPEGQPALVDSRRFE